MRSWWSIPARPIARGRLPRSSARGCSTSSGSMTSPRPGTRRWRGPRAIMPSGWMPMTWSTRRSGRSSRRCSTVCGRATRPLTWSAARAIPGRTAMAGRRSWIISGCSRSARMSAGPTPCTSRSCRPCGRGMCRCGGRTSRSGTPATPTRRCGSGSSSATAGSSKRSWPSGPEIRSCSSTWARSPSSGRTGTRALEHLRHSLAGSAPTDSITRKLFALIARCHQMLGDIPTALAACSEGLSFDPDDAELLFRKAVLHRTAGQPAEAESCWRRILTLKRPEQFCSVDQGIYGHLTLRNLAVLAAERGDHDRGRRPSGGGCSTNARGTPRQRRCWNTWSPRNRSRCRARRLLEPCEPAKRASEAEFVPGPWLKEPDARAAAESWLDLRGGVWRAWLIRRVSVSQGDLAARGRSLEHRVTVVLRYRPVWLSGAAAMASGGPMATIRPPRLRLRAPGR